MIWGICGFYLDIFRLLFWNSYFKVLFIYLSLYYDYCFHLIFGSHLEVLWLYFQLCGWGLFSLLPGYLWYWNWFTGMCEKFGLHPSVCSAGVPCGTEIELGLDAFKTSSIHLYLSLVQILNWTQTSYLWSMYCSPPSHFFLFSGMNFIIYLFGFWVLHSGITPWLCMGDYIGCWGSHLGWLHARKILYLLYFCSGPTFWFLDEFSSTKVVVSVIIPSLTK